MLREFFAGLSIVIALIIFGFSLTQPLITIYQLWIFSSIWVVYCGSFGYNPKTFIMAKTR